MKKGKEELIRTDPLGPGIFPHIPMDVQNDLIQKRRPIIKRSRKSPFDPRCQVAHLGHALARAATVAFDTCETHGCTAEESIVAAAQILASYARELSHDGKGNYHDYKVVGSREFNEAWVPKSQRKRKSVEGKRYSKQHLSK